MHKLHEKLSSSDEFRQLVDFLVGKASHISDIDAEVHDAAEELTKQQKRRALSEDELFEFVSLFTEEQLSYVGF